MKKNFVEAEIEIELLSALEDIMFQSPTVDDLTGGEKIPDGWDEG